MRKTYRSAVDAWLALLLIGVPATMLVLGLGRLDAAPKEGAFLIVQGVFVASLMAAFCLPCRYTLTDEHLHVRCGVIATTVPLGRVERAELSRSLWSAPALSLQRVRIDYGAEHVVISPRGREAFIADLMAAVARCKGGEPSRLSR